MRNLTVAVLILFASVVYSQSQTAPKSKAEQFSEMEGTLVQKVFVDIGKFNKVDFQVLYYTDLVNGKSISAMRLSLNYQSQYTSDEKVAVLDRDEVDSLMKSVNYLITNATRRTATSYEEMLYTSRAGFKLGCYWDADTSSWKGFMKLERFDKDSSIYFNSEGLLMILSLLDKVRSKMK
jgi:hypothetical protein